MPDDIVSLDVFTTNNLIALGTLIAGLVVHVVKSLYDISSRTSEHVSLVEFMQLRPYRLLLSTMSAVFAFILLALYTGEVSPMLAGAIGYFADHALDTILGNRFAAKQRSGGSPAPVAGSFTPEELHRRLAEIREKNPSSRFP